MEVEMKTARKYSRKREAILKTLRSTKAHPSAEWIYARLKPTFPDLSLGTVYRNLSLFRTEGLVTSVATVKGQERFDAQVIPHPHFICDSCGKVLDMDMLPYFGPAQGTVGFDGGEVEYCEILFHGKCNDCKQ